MPTVDTWATERNKHFVREEIKIISNHLHGYYGTLEIRKIVKKKKKKRKRKKENGKEIYVENPL